jgi:hypothetical protein
MTIRIANGQFIITRPDGTTTFNVDDKLLHITNVVSGVLTIPEVQGGAPSSGGPGSQNLTTVYDLGAVNASATQVIGAVKFVLNGSGNGLAYNRWHTVMGGTIIWVMDGAGLTSQGRRTNGALAQLVTYHFDISAGRCRMIRRVVIATGFLYGIQAHNIEYKLRCGAWV